MGGCGGGFNRSLQRWRDLKGDKFMMLDTRRAQFRGSLVVVALLSAIRLHATEFVLDEDKVINVPSNETLEYSSLSGNAYKLTKTGAGKLVFGAISNPGARIVVEEGSLEVRTQVPDKPAVLSSAWLHLDADSLSTMTCNEIDGVSYVAQWRDANGNGISLTGESGVKSTWEAFPNTDPKRLPFLVPAFCNGRTVVDLGDLVHKGMQSPQIGRGGAFSFSKQCSTMREAFLVVGDTENAKR
jgi:autotransporter-associated beta strand protein